jgi:hypothetical protein
MSLITSTPSRPRRPARILAVGLTLVLLAGACGDDDDEGAEVTTPPGTPVERAEADVEAAQADLDEARDAYEASRDAFCSDTSELIEVLDRYGRLLDDRAVTVGDIRTGADDLASGRDTVGEAADTVLAERDAVADAEAALVEAEAALAAAIAEEETGTTADAPESDSTTTTTEPLVAAEVTAAVADAEEALAEAFDSVTDATPVAEAGVRLGSAAFAVQVTWMRLFVEAGCLSDEEQAEALAWVTDYTTALQTALEAAGHFTGPIDGVYGPATIDAVESFQEAAGLPVTGLVDPATDRALQEAVQAATDADLVGLATYNAAVQSALSLLGYWDGPIDGMGSEQLTAAVVRLQEDLGLEPTGLMDPPTVAAIHQAIADATEGGGTTSTTAPDETTTTTAPSRPAHERSSRRPRITPIG